MGIKKVDESAGRQGTFIFTPGANCLLFGRTPSVVAALRLFFLLMVLMVCAA
jgi:hypothetical protein